MTLKPYFSALGTFAATLMLAGTASAYTLTCQMTDMKQSGNWIPTAITLEVSDDETGVEITGPKALVQQFGGFNGEIDVANAKRLTAKMRVDEQRSTSGQFVNMQYRLTWLRKNNKATITAVPLGYSNRFKARGTCTKS